MTNKQWRGGKSKTSETVDLFETRSSTAGERKQRKLVEFVANWRIRLMPPSKRGGR